MHGACHATCPWQPVSAPIDRGKAGNDRLVLFHGHRRRHHQGIAGGQGGLWQRGAENSIWHALGVGPGAALDLLSLGPVAAAGVWAALAARAAARGGEEQRAVRLGTALLLVLWIALNKVWSPQYALYGFLAGALAGAPGWLFAALSAASIADYLIEFEVRARHWEAAFVRRVVIPSEIARTLLWLLLAALVARALARAARGPVSSPRTT